jgi:hypothetical protein
MNNMEQHKDKIKECYRLTEEFINEVEKMNLNEGWWDTAKASAAGAKGSIQGLGQQLKGNFNKAVGNVANKGINYVAKGLGGDPSKSPWAKSAQNLSKQGQSQIDTGKQMGYNAKYDSYIQNSIDTLVNDLQNLNIPISDKNKLMSDVKKSIVSNTQASSGSGIAKKTASPTPANSKPTPKSISNPSSTQSGGGGIAKPAPASTPATTGQKMATAPQKSMTTPPSSKGNTVGQKAVPSQISKIPKGSVMSANGRQTVSQEEPTVQQNPVPEKPKQQTTNQAEKQYAKDKVKSHLKGQLNKAA